MENWYEGCVSMRPEMTKSEFYSGDSNFTYKLPKIHFECGGENDLDNKAFGWSRDSIVLIKDRRTVKYTEFISKELLVTDENGENVWIDGTAADIMGLDAGCIADFRDIVGRWIEEYDWDKSEKRRYKLVLEETSQIDNNDIVCVMGNGSGDSDNYIMKVSEK